MFLCASVSAYLSLSVSGVAGFFVSALFSLSFFTVFSFLTVIIIVTVIAIIIFI